MNELRRVSDGKLVCKLEEADITELKAKGWKAPEIFVAKGRDGKTDIWGLVYRPREFDPNRYKSYFCRGTNPPMVTPASPEATT